MLDLCGADHAMMHVKDPLAVENQRTKQDVFPAALTRLMQICCDSLTAKRSMYTTQHEHGTTAWLQSSSLFPCIFYHFLFCSFDSVVVPYYGEAFPIFDI